MELRSCSTQLENMTPPKVKLNIVQKSDLHQVNSHNESFVPRQKFRCILGCKTPHRLHDFPTYMSWYTDSRRSFIKSALPCYVCLVTSHNARNCSKIKSGGKSENLKNVSLSYPRESCNVETGFRSNEKVNSKEFSPMVVSEVRCNNGTMGKS